jgi:hypothetical protein
MAIAKPIILYDNRFLDAIPTATDTETGYSVSNITDLRPFTFWQADSPGTKYITVNCAGAKSADCLGIVGHNFFTASATVSVESSATGAWAGEEVVRLAGFTVTTDKAVLKTFTTASAQYWRIKVVTGSVAAKMAICVLGVRLDMEKQVQQTFDPCPEKLNATSARSKAGYMIGSTLKNISFEIQANFSNLTDSWLRGAFTTAWVAHLSLCKPFFWVWNPTTYPADVYLVAIPPEYALKRPYTYIKRDLSLIMQGVKET